MPKPHVLLLLFATVLFGWLVYSFVNVDFWNDEIYTLKAFTFVPLHTTLTDYHAPNNHVFLNLVDNLYLRLLGINTLKTVDANTLQITVFNGVLCFVNGPISLFVCTGSKQQKYGSIGNCYIVKHHALLQFFLGSTRIRLICLV
jgi:hypothetical protein